MRAIFNAVIAVLLLSSTSVAAQTLVKPGTCEMVVASRKSLSEAQNYIRQIDDKRFVKVFKATNGWYAISIGALKLSEEDAVLSSWKASGKIPNDAFCSTGKKYVAQYNWRTGKKETVGKVTNASVNTSKADKDGNPFYTKNYCRTIYNEQNNAQDMDKLFDPVEAVFKERGYWQYFVGIFQLKNGRYVVAETLPYYFENKEHYLKTGGEYGINMSGNPYKKRKNYGSLSQRCTDGTDIALDTGLRLTQKGKVGDGHLLLKGLVAGANALKNAGRSSSSGVRCVTVSGDCTGLDCIIDDITLSGGAGNIENSNNRSSSMVCSGYNGALNGTYNYTMKTNFDRICSGSFRISSKAQSGVTVNVYETCSAGYVSEY